MHFPGDHTYGVVGDVVICETHADGRQVAMLSTPDGFFLAWTKNEHEKTFDDDDMASRPLDTRAR